MLLLKLCITNHCVITTTHRTINIRLICDSTHYVNSQKSLTRKPALYIKMFTQLKQCQQALKFWRRRSLKAFPREQEAFLYDETISYVAFFSHPHFFRSSGDLVSPTHGFRRLRPICIPSPNEPQRNSNFKQKFPDGGNLSSLPSLRFTPSRLPSLLSTSRILGARSCMTRPWARHIASLSTNMFCSCLVYPLQKFH